MSILRLLATALSASVVLAVCAACCFLPAPSGTSGSASSAPSTPSGSSVRTRLLGEIRPGGAYGEGPGAEGMALGLRAIFTPGDGIGVWVDPSVPRRVVVLVEMDDDAVEGLADLDPTERRTLLDSVLGMLDYVYGTTADEVGIGLRGNLFFGAVLIRHPGMPPTYDTSAVADTGGLDALLAPPAPLPTAAPVPTPPPPAPPGT